MALSLVDYGDSSSEEEAEGEQDVSEQRGDGKKSDVRKLLGVLPPPKGNRTKKQPVRIALPTLQAGDDSDDDEAPAAKRHKSTGSGLTALLPEPKAVPKELGGGERRPASTRSMVPYTLSKRRQDGIKSAKAKATKAKAAAANARKGGGGGGEGSDSDEEPVSFFSHLEETETKCSTDTPLVPAPTATQYSSVAATAALPPVGTVAATAALPPVGVPQIQSYSSSVSTGGDTLRTVFPSAILPPLYPSADVITTLTTDHSTTLTSAPHTSSLAPSSHQAPLTLSPLPHPSFLNPPSHPGHWAPPPTNPAQYTTPYYHPDPTHTQSVHQHNTSEQCYGTPGGTSGGYGVPGGTSGGYGTPGGSNSGYGTPGGTIGGYGVPSGTSGGYGGTSGSSHTQCSVSNSGPSGVPETGEMLGGAGPGITIDSETLRRLAGGGMKRRGRDEGLRNIVDVAGDEVMESIKVYRRNHGDDPAIARLYKADGTKLKAPSGMQKRKHQITWLAHEAKERDLELQKMWAKSSQTRRDTRTKYGF